MRRAAVAALLVVAACSDATAPKPAATPTVPADPPATVREFRGLWIATVANIDWPTSSSLSVDAQRAELRALLDKAQSLGMNAVILQVRSAGDALYRSTLEPWARPLTGTQGNDPGWDPLAEAVLEAHARGLELHAWFNPFRAGNLSDTIRLAPTHLYRARPDLGRIAQNQLWFDPGEPEVQDHVMRVVLDVVARYDIDGVHLDDYFYPYPVSGAALPIQFPDDGSYARYLAAGGAAMDRAEWRRQNVNKFLQRLYLGVKGARATVKVGISPFGIWRPGNPAGITGLDAWRDIFADSKFWLQQGWMDYCAPQLYWSLASTGQNFTALLDWWLDANIARRHLWPGLAAYRVADGTSSAFAASEITNQLSLVRTAGGARAGGARGALLYNATVVRTNRGGLADALATSFEVPALVPATPWLDAVSPGVPQVTVESLSQSIRVQWSPAAGDSVSWWLVRWRQKAGWRSRLVWGATRNMDLSGVNAADRPDAVAVAALDRVMNMSSDARWRAP